MVIMGYVVPIWLNLGLTSLNMVRQMELGELVPIQKVSKLEVNRLYRLWRYPLWLLTGWYLKIVGTKVGYLFSSIHPFLPTFELVPM